MLFKSKKFFSFLKKHGLRIRLLRILHKIEIQEFSRIVKVLLTRDVQ